MKKKLLALFLVLVMVMGMFPMSAMAVEYPTAEWYNFRNSANNMGITNALTPKSAVYTQLDSVTVFTDYVGTPIIVGGYMYVATGDKTSEDNVLRKLDLKTGQTLATGKLAIYFNSNNSNVAPIYIQEKGLIVVPLHEGVVEAFNINDLSTAWVYQDKPTSEINGAKVNANGLGGQVQTHLVYSDGMIYAGFWNKETASANFVCLNADNGELVWYYTHLGGFYWSAPIVLDNHVVVGTDNGVGTGNSAIAGASSYILSFKKADNTEGKAATPISKLELAGIGDQRSSLAYDKAGGRVYFTTKNGYICSAAIDSSQGTLSDLKTFQEPNCTSSTNTPVVYGDYVYYGAGKYNGFYFIVANKDTLQTVAKIKMKGNPQGSFLLSTAYAESENYLYFYATYNLRPGGLSLIKVPTASPTNDKLILEEIYDALSYEDACINSPICRADGTIYYRNDSKAIFALSPTVIEVPRFAENGNLSTDLIKLQHNSNSTPLAVTATVGDGGELSYKWQSAASANGPWSDIIGANESSYAPKTDEKGTTYYHCVVGNYNEGHSVYSTSLAAEILVKDLSNNATLNIAANTANKLYGAKAGTVKTIDNKKIVYVDNYTDGTVKYIAIGAAEEGSLPLKSSGAYDNAAFRLYQGLTIGTSMPSPGNVSNSELYTKRYYRSGGFTLPFVASLEVTAEDGVTKETNYIVIDDKPLGKYTIGVSGFTADADTYFKDNAIAFTEAGQSVTLTPVTTTIGEGEENKTAWTWESSDTKVAYIDKNGVVKSVGGGSAVISFTCGQLTASCNVTSSAPAHAVHTYVDGECSACHTEEPDAIKAYFSLTKDGAFVKAKDGASELCRVEINVADADCDGKLTLNDAFIAAHAAYSANGKADFATEASNYGAYIVKLWGESSPICGYKLNNQYATGLDMAVAADDHIAAYFYKDTVNYSDIYAYFENAETKTVAKTEKVFTVKGDAGGREVVLNGAAVTVYDAEGAVVAELATEVGENGSFSIIFPEAGEYTVEVCGTAAYTGSVWDSTLNNGEGGYKEQKFDAAPVIPARIDVSVSKYVSAKIYATISDTSGNFVTDKNGKEVYRLEVTVEDDAENPDGQITIREMLSSVHAQHHINGASAFAVEKTYYGDSITKLWGIPTNSSVSYCFNDVFIKNDGAEKTGTNGRQFTDKLLDTVVADNDCINVYLYQEGSNWTDIYTYFEAVTDTATVGKAKTLTVKAGEAMSGAVTIPVGAAVKVTNSKGEEQTALNTTVGENGAFTVTFPAAGTYTVEVRSKGTVYVTPSRCVVTVTAAEEEGGGGGSEEEDTTITVSFSLITHNATWIAAHDITLDKGATVADAFHKVLDRRAGFSYDADPDYVRSITYKGQTLAEFSMGPNSGWKYMINGVAPGVGMLNMPLEDGDELVWYYVTDYTEDTDRDEGGGFGGSDETEDEETEESGGGAGGGVTIAPEATVSGDKATANVGASDINNALEEAKKDETVTNVTIAPEVKGEANSVTVEVPKTSVSDVAKSGLGLTVETDIADVKLPAKALEDVSSKSGQKVSVSAEKTESGAVSVEIAVDGKAIDKVNGGVVINLPAEDTGKVLVIVNEDGSETVVKKSVAGEDSVSAVLEGSATVKLVDNKKEFNDTAKHWGASAIDFATSRELFDGVDEGVFDPDGTMTRAMLVTVLYRLEGEPEHDHTHEFGDVADGQWYSEAVAWANGLGIVEGDGTGFDPNGEVTREQIAVILHRYAKYLEMSTHHEGDMTQFNDHHETSDWALEAKTWAVGAGLITGKDGNKLDPTGDATRAEVATILERLVGLMVE